MKIKDFIHNEVSGSVILITMTIVALLCANSGLVSLYQSFKDIAQFSVNDVLMTFFFLLVGLELKREIIAGELSTRAKALQPIFAALGGVIVPILFFWIANKDHSDTLRGWAIPCATDIAFALGILALLGSRVPVSIKVLLTAIAIIDDLIAILVIAVFYTDALQWMPLLVAFGGVALLVSLNYFKVLRVSLYLATGALIWMGFLQAGLHPTLAGVVTAMAIPLNKKITLEKKLHPWVVFAVIPLFAFTNAGLGFAGIYADDLYQPLAAGIISGLVFGKPLGIMAGLWLGHKIGLAVKPVRTEWKDYFGMAVLCGIGFTMSLFIGDLAFEDTAHLDQVKLGVLAASLFMALAGYIMCRFSFERKKHV